MKNKLIYLVVVLVVVSIIAFIFLKVGIKEKPEELRFGALARVKGSENAPINIVEFMDFRCPPCALGSKYLKLIIDENPGAIRLEMKYFPLSVNKYFALSARYAECAAQQGKFWQYHDVLVEEQKAWKKYMNPQKIFETYAEQVDLDSKKLDACLQDKAIFKNIISLKTEGKNLGVKSTPTYFINGKKIVGTKTLETEVTRLLKEHAGRK